MCTVEYSKAKEVKRGEKNNMGTAKGKDKAGRIQGKSDEKDGK